MLIATGYMIVGFLMGLLDLRDPWRWGNAPPREKFWMVGMWTALWPFVLLTRTFT